MGPPPLKSNFKNFAPACTSSRRSLKPPLFQSRRLRDSCRRQGLAVPCRRDEFSKLFLGLSKFFNSRVFNRIAATSRAYKSFSSLVSSLSSFFLLSLHLYHSLLSSLLDYLSLSRINELDKFLFLFSSSFLIQPSFIFFSFRLLSKMTRANEFENFLLFLFNFSIEDTRSKMNSISLFSSFFFFTNNSFN